MSSYDGSTLTDATNPSLQLAPAENEAPDFGALKKSYEDCLSGNQGFIDQCEENRQTRYAIWAGQSADGRKHAREGNGKTDPTPWDGASDLRVFLCDEAIMSKVAMLCVAFKKANIVATPTEGNDIKRAKIVANFMRWLIQTQVPEIDREVELLANIVQEHGVGAIGTFWQETQEKVLTTVTLDQLQEQFPTLNMQELIFAEEAADNLLAIFEEIYGCTKKKARKMLAELRDKQTTTVPTLGRKRSRPVIRAFNLNENLFIPSSSTDLETAPRIFRVEYYSPEQLRAFVVNSGWDEEWVECAIEKLRGRQITLSQSDYGAQQARSFNYVDQVNKTDLIGVVYAYERLSDEDGYTGLYCSVFNPQMGPDDLQDGYAKTGLLGFAHGDQPFVLFRREMLSRKLHDSRGIPEPGKPWQQQIKVHLDSRIDAASLAICPPMGYPVGRPPLKWGANARVPERRPGEYHLLETPRGDMNTEKSQDLLTTGFNKYNGFQSRETDPVFSNLKNQFESEKWMTSWGKVFRQTYGLFQQFGADEVFFRVIGLKQVDPTQFTKGDPTEEFDFRLSFSVESMDPEQTFKKLEQIAKIVATADRDGVIDYSEWIQVMIEAVDATIAERIISPKEVGQARIVADMQDMIAKVYAGFEQDIKLGTPPQLGMQVLRSYVQGDPQVQSRMANKEDPFGQRIEKLAKQFSMQSMQEDNKRIGKYGA